MMLHKKPLFFPHDPWFLEAFMVDSADDSENEAAGTLINSSVPPIFVLLILYLCGAFPITCRWIELRAPFAGIFVLGVLRVVRLWSAAGQNSRP